jgi:hypothetical protein
MVPSAGLRIRALVTLVAFVASLGLPVFSLSHYALDDDTACGSIQLTPTQSSVQLDQKRPSLPLQHCAICHWLRAVGGSQTTDVTVVQAWLEPAPAAPVAAEAWRPATTDTARPSRAPPALIG